LRCAAAGDTASPTVTNAQNPTAKFLITSLLLLRSRYNI
jgi:hypothetical protein